MRDLPAGLLREVVDLELGLEELAMADQRGAVVVVDLDVVVGARRSLDSGLSLRRRRGRRWRRRQTSCCASSVDPRGCCCDCSSSGGGSRGGVGASCSSSTNSNSSSSEAQRRGLRRRHQGARLRRLLRPRAAEGDG